MLALGLAAGGHSSALAGDSNAELRQKTADMAKDLFERRVFEPYLHFSSKADEQDFRKHELDTKRYVAAQLAQHTPEGNLNASGGIIDYVLDAKDHGADRSPAWSRFSQ